MNYRPLSALLALSGAAMAFPALAQDAAPDVSQGSRDSHFDGPYISATIGLGAQGNDRGSDHLVFDTDGDGKFDNVLHTNDGGNAFSPGFCGGVARGAAPSAGCRRDRDKLEYSARIGYDKRFGNWVGGALIEAAKGNSSDGVSGYSVDGNSYSFRRKLDYAVSARARAGYTPGGGALFYVTGGGGMAKIDHDFATTDATNEFTAYRGGKKVWGWQAGGGGEIMLTDNLGLGLEYLYNRYSDGKYHVVSGETAMRPSDTKFDYHSLRASVNLQF